MNNAPPELTLDTAGIVAFAGGDAFLGREGVQQWHTARAADPGSDDLTFTWQWTQDGEPTKSTYFNGVAEDPPQSPEINPMDVTDTAGVIFDAPGVYEITVTVTDDDGASASSTFTKLVTGNLQEAAGVGFWRHQFAAKRKQQIHDEALLAYLEIINFTSRVFDEDVPLNSLADAKNIRQPGGPDVDNLDPSNIKGKATQQVFAAWLNFASGAIRWDDDVPTGPAPDSEDVFSAAMIDIEDILLDLDGDQDHKDYALANDMAAAMNEMDH